MDRKSTTRPFDSGFWKSLAEKRKKHGFSQITLVRALEEKGISVTPGAIRKREKNVTLPNVIQFFVLCEILDIIDINEVFGVCVTETVYTLLNRSGKLKVLKCTNLLHRSGLYERTYKDNFEEERVNQARVYPVEF